MDRLNNYPNTPLLPKNEVLEDDSAKKLLARPYSLDKKRAEVCLSAVQGVCDHRKWALLGAHFRPEHVHVVVHAKVPPERVMNDFKSYSSRELKKISSAEARITERWARHGSTRYLFDVEAVEKAIHYTLHEQGDPFVTFVNRDLPTTIGAILAGESRR